MYFIEAVHTRLTELKKAKEEITKSIGQDAEGDELRKQLSENTQNLRKMVATSLPQLQEQKKYIDMHLAVATKLFNQINERDLNLYVTLEDGIINGIAQDKSQILKVIKENKGTPEDNLRLYYIYYLNKDSVPASVAEEIENALREDTPYIAATPFIKEFVIFKKLNISFLNFLIYVHTELKSFHQLLLKVNNLYLLLVNVVLCQDLVNLLVQLLE